MQPRAAACYRVQSVGESALERVLSLVLLGDLVSLYLAVLAGLDPSPVELIEEFKVSLAAVGETTPRPSPMGELAELPSGRGVSDVAHA